MHYFYDSCTVATSKCSMNNIVYLDEGMKGLYFTSDIAHRDLDGDYQIIGRSDDVIRYKGEMLNIPYIENMAVSVHAVYIARAAEMDHLIVNFEHFQI